MTNGFFVNKYLAGIAIRICLLNVAANSDCRRESPSHYGSKLLLKYGVVFSMWQKTIILKRICLPSIVENHECNMELPSQ